MAYVSKETSNKIKTAVRELVKQNDGWKVTVRVFGHMKVIATIRKVPDYFPPDVNYINHYHLDRDFEGASLNFLKKLVDALNIDNYDNSDPASDYFNVGHYIGISTEL